MTTDQEPARARSRAAVSWAAVAVVATLCMLYAAGQFLRNSVGVLAPDLAREVGLSAFELGMLSSVFLFTLALAQFPLGVALDRFGPKVCTLVCVGFLVAGAALFALAHSAAGLMTARALMGLGTASFLVAPIALYARWFPKERLSTVSGIHLGVGTLGILFATAPLAYATATVGWRETFLAVAALSVAVGLSAWLVVRDDPPGATPAPRKPESLGEGIAGIWQVIRTPSMGRLFLAALASTPTFLLVVGLWAGPYLTHVYGFDLKGRGDILFIPALAQCAGAFFWGPLDRWFGNYRHPATISLAVTFCALAFIAIAGKPPLPLLIVALAALGFSTSIASLLMAHGRSLVAPHLLGRSITLLNIGSMGGGFLVQFVSGALIGLFDAPGGVYPLDAYRLVFGLQAAFILLAAWAYFGSRDADAGAGSGPGR
jgi:MFS family permease